MIFAASGPTSKINPHFSGTLLILLLLALNMLLYLPAVKGDFVMDDHSLIVNNPALQNSRFLREFLFTPFGIEAARDDNSRRLAASIQYYRPLTSLSFYLDYQLWGFNSSGFHMTNILIHLVNLLLLYRLLAGVGFPPFPAYLGTLLFSVIPFHFENVAWISGRTDLLSFCFVALSSLFFLDFYRRRKQPSLWISALFYLLSLLAKENTLLLPLVYLGVMSIGKKKKIGDFFTTLLPFAVSFLSWAALRFIALDSIGVPGSGRGLMDLVAALGFYASRLLTPFFLPVTIDSLTVFSSMVYKCVGLLLVAAFLLSLYFIFKKRVRLSHPLYLVFFFCTLILPSVLIILSGSTFSYLAWRFMYLPAAVVCGYLIYYLFKRVNIPWLRVMTIGVLVIFFSLELVQKTSFFGQKRRDFWLNMKSLGRECILVRYNSALYLLETDERKGEAILQQILNQKKHPFHAIYKLKVLEALGRHYTRRGQLRKAEENFQRILREEKAYPLSFWFSYANFLALSGRQAEGERIILRQLRNFPKNHLVLIHGARFYMIIKNYSKAKDILEKDYRLFPSRQTRQLLEQLEKLTVKIPLNQSLLP